MSALAAVAVRLRCPVCGEPLAAGERALACASGHSFDIARQGYVSLLPPRGAAPGDTAAMVAARDAFLGAGHFAPIADAVAAAVRAADAAAPGGEPAPAPLVVDLGAGTGYYLAAALDARPGALAVALDTSARALRRADRAHSRIAAVACDIWQALPLADGAADVILNVFAPRNGAEITRVLAPGGTVVVVTPTGRHLRELADLGTLKVEEGKRERVHAALAPLEPAAERCVEFELALDDGAVRALIAMGPSAHHVDPAGAAGRSVTASVVIETFRG